ncbi:hypothetical protein [Thalassolituus sp. UBA3500]|uniref:hypothetical protein n=1 Tax=Thalassolituus sp. UBA3500 TaxID=1947664 RepID=UPI000C10986C|nr:hypothetical protein [Thalassolituus sp. UBA3500]MBN58267.1 hypothetical protein [Oceanospirillaceae bacterium]
MSNNLFKTAVQNNETVKFFLGKDEYFSRNRETHEHAYFAQTKGWVKKYIEEDPDKNLTVFINKLSEFLGTEESQENIESVIENILALAVLFSRNPIYFSSLNKSSVSILYSSIERYFSSLNLSQPEIDDLNIYKDRIIEIGCLKLSEQIKL